MGYGPFLIIAFTVSIDTFILGFQSDLDKKKLGHALLIAFVQTTLFSLGFVVGENIFEPIRAFDHWIILITLSYIGFKTIKSSKAPPPSLSFQSLVRIFILAFLVSIDALTIGYSISETDALNFWLAAILFIITLLSVLFGGRLSQLQQNFDFKTIQTISGVLLIGIGIRMFITHMLDHGMEF